MAALFGASDAARLERAYAAPEIVEQRAITRAALAARDGERGLEIGCGPGFLCTELAGEIAPRGRITAIDASPEMIEAARARAARTGTAGLIDFAVGDAERLEFPDATFDFVVGVQVYLYVENIGPALAEVARVLRPGGRLVLVDTDWDSCVWLTSDRQRHRRVLDARLAHFAQPHLPPHLPALLGGAGLTLAEARVIPLINVRYDPESFSVGILGSTRSLAVKHGVDPAEAEAWEADLRARTGEGEYFFSLNRFLFRATRPGRGGA